MIFQFILSGGLLFVLFYARLEKPKSPFVSVLAAIFALIGLYFVWLPDHANTVARLIGVGRGADLILYCWVVISMVIMLNLHLKIRHNLEQISELARAVSIMEADKYSKQGGSLHRASSDMDSVP